MLYCKQLAPLWGGTRVRNTGVVRLDMFNQTPDSLREFFCKEALFPKCSHTKRASFLLFDTEMRHARG